MGLFQTMRQKDLARNINAARSIVIYAAPSVTDIVATSLISAARRIGPGNVIVILDVSAHAARMGYGRFETVEPLAKAGINVRVEPGLRQGLLIVDNCGWAFTLPAELVEADADEKKNAPNAIELTTAQIFVLRGELPQPERAEKEPSPSEQFLPAALGAVALTDSVIEQVRKELKVAPPQPFDLARQVQVYTALVRFVELEMKGWRLESRRVELPKSLPILATQDRGLKQRIRSSLNLLDQIQDGQLKALRAEVEEIRKAFCVPVGVLGSVILAQFQSELEKRVKDVDSRLEKAKKAVTAKIADGLKQMVDGLVPELARAVLRDLPDGFRWRYGQTPEGAEEYVRHELSRVLPKAEEITKGMSLRLDFKDVTYAVLKNEAFKDKVLTSFSRSVLPGELLTEYDAARKRVESAKPNAGPDLFI